ncbi:MAG: HEPN domain-containing protein [bacterium]|jgi:HEPN domain-containing protein|nr:HEPN domain-containing protein [bacterium]
MVDVIKQISYWRSSAEEDWDVANRLITAKKVRHGLFFVHLAIEKVLKAHVCKKTLDLAPRIHNLIRLAELSSLELNPGQQDLLAELNAFNIEGRYPEWLLLPPTVAEAKAYLKQAKEIYQWLLNQL